MPASNTRVVAVAAVLLLVALAGGLGWRQMRPSASAHVDMLAAMPQGTRGAMEPAAPSPSAKSSISPAQARAATPAVEAGDKNAPQPPSFDIVRVEPGGEALLAGRGAPNGTVALVERGKVVAEARADAGGNFVMTPPALKPGDYALSLREGQGAAARESKQSVVVSVLASKTQPVVVAMAEPGRATTLLSAPPEPTEAAAPKPTAPTPKSQSSAPPAKLAIRSVELENGSGLFASGVAPPGTDVRLYLNDSRVADVIAAAAGSWTVTVHKGLAAGRYAVRADTLKADRTVDARVEVPFDVPAPMGDVAAHAASPAAGAAPRVETPPSQTRMVAEAGASPGRGDGPEAVPGAPEVRMRTRADAVIEELKTEIVTRGGNLWRISRNRLGHGTRYTEIYAANTAQIRDPKLIYPGQVFVLPRE